MCLLLETLRQVTSEQPPDSLWDVTHLIIVLDCVLHIFLQTRLKLHVSFSSDVCVVFVRHMCNQLKLGTFRATCQLKPT